MNMVSSADAHNSIDHCSAEAGRLYMKMRRKAAKAAAFGGRKETGDGRRSPLVDIRGPGLERSGGDFEGETHKDQCNREAEQLVGKSGLLPGKLYGADRGLRQSADGGGAGGDGMLSAVKHGADLGEPRRAGDAEQQRDSIKKKAGGKRAQQKIFQGSLAAIRHLAAESDQDIARKRGDLQADEDQDQLIAGSHQVHAYGGKQQQGIVFSGGQPLPANVVHRGECGQRRDQEEKQ